MKTWSRKHAFDKTQDCVSRVHGNGGVPARAGENETAPGEEGGGDIQYAPIARLAEICLQESRPQRSKSRCPRSGGFQGEKQIIDRHTRHVIRRLTLRAAAGVE